MSSRPIAGWLFAIAAVVLISGAKPAASPIPPGRQHVLTIEGENLVTFVPEAGLKPLPVNYQARIEYLVNTQTAAEIEAQRLKSAKETRGRRSTSIKAKAKGDRKPAKAAKPTDEVEADGDETAPKPGGSVELAVHATKLRLQQNGRTVVESRISRARFKGRLQPDAPILNVSYNEAPPALKSVLGRFDTKAASIQLDDRSNVIGRRVGVEGGMHAIVETLLSIHTPIPRDAGAWESPTQLAMGHGHTAKGTLRFEKIKEGLDKTDGLVKVKVSGVLDAEGIVVGNLVKNGTFTVTGEQHYDPKSREWTSARWSVAVKNELTNQDGMTVAHTLGKMIVQSKALAGAPAEPRSSEAAPDQKP